MDHLQICQRVFYNTVAWKLYKSLSYSRQCVVTVYIKHHVALPLMITAPRIRLVQSTGIRPTVYREALAYSAVKSHSLTLYLQAKQSQPAKCEPV